MTDEFKITMPHRHTVIYEDKDNKLEFGVEAAIDGIIFYAESYKVLEGKKNNYSTEVARVKSFLEQNFGKVTLWQTNLKLLCHTDTPLFMKMTIVNKKYGVE